LNLYKNYLDNFCISSKYFYFNYLKNKLNKLNENIFNKNLKKIKKNKNLELLNKKNNFFLFKIISYFGLNFFEFLDYIKYPNILLFDSINTSSEFLYFNFKLLEKYFEIGEFGRYSINTKLNLKLPKLITYLTIHDFIEIINNLLKLKYFNKTEDDIDHLKNKQIIHVGYFLKKQLNSFLINTFEKNENFKIKLNNFKIINKIILKNLTYKKNFNLNKNYIKYIFKFFDFTDLFLKLFKITSITQFFDQINPLSELTHKRKINLFKFTNLKNILTKTNIRDIHPSQYTKLCPIETAEGLNAGLISILALYTRLGLLETLESPYFYNNNINQKILKKKYIITLNSHQESKYNINLLLKNLKQKIYSIKQNYLFFNEYLKNIKFSLISPFQIFSIATNLIPFLEHNDANRALMGANMQRQAVPLIYSQKPIVGTGLESILLLDSGLIIKSYSYGIVTFSSTKKIIIKDNNNQKIFYFLKKYLNTNQETCINQSSLVWIGEKVFSGQIIADTFGTQDGELSLGQNLVVAYMPWEGYNYEDSIIINEKLVIQNLLTSIHIKEFSILYNNYNTTFELLTNQLPHVSINERNLLSRKGLIKIGTYIKENNILLGKIIPKELIFLNLDLINLFINEQYQNYYDTSILVPYGIEGRLLDIRILENIPFDENVNSILNSYNIIKFYVATIRKIKIGDKLSGRHGNKGIISKILNTQDMPYLPNGLAVDIILNPLGVPSRMNVGQIFEAILGLSGMFLGKRFKILPFDEMYGKNASQILINQKLKEAALKTKNFWLTNLNYSNKIFLKDGRTGEFFDNPITVGKSYILKLIHLVDDKINARTNKNYCAITEQPVSGKFNLGGQRFGEMEVWALEGYGASQTLQELLTIKSDDIDGRNIFYNKLVFSSYLDKITSSISEAFLVLIKELNGLSLNLSLFRIKNGFSKTKKIREYNKNIFKEIELKLKLKRNYLKLKKK